MRYKFITFHIIPILLSLFFIVSILPAQNLNQGQFGGVGMQITKQNNAVVILSIIPGTPAERAGLKVGDALTHINGESVGNKSLEEVVRSIRGEIGSNVDMTFKRAGEDTNEQLVTVSLNRENITTSTTRTQPQPPPESIQPLPPGINGLSTGLPIFYLTPLTSQVSPGKSFQIQIILDNPKGIMADELGLWIQYNPKSLTLNNNTSNIFIHISQDIFNNWSVLSTYHQATSGDIFLHLKSTNPLKQLSGILGFMEFQAGSELPYTQIQYRFNQWGNYPNTFLLLNGKDILGSKSDPLDGTIGSTIRVQGESNLSVQ